MPTKDELQEALNEANEILAATQVHRDEVIRKLDAAKKQIADLEFNLADILAGHENVNATNVRVREELNAAKQALGETEVARDELIQKLDDTNTELEDLHAATSEDRIDLEARIAELQAGEDEVYGAKDARIQDLDEANQDLRDRIAKLQTGDQAAAAEEAETANEDLAGAKLNATEAKRAAEVSRKTLFAFDQEAMIDTKAIPDSVLDGNERRGLVRDLNRITEDLAAAKRAVSVAKDVVESFAA